MTATKQKWEANYYISLSWKIALPVLVKGHNILSNSFRLVNNVNPASLTYGLMTTPCNT